MSRRYNCLATSWEAVTDVMILQCHGPSHDFEKQCVNEMSRNTLRKQMRVMEGRQTLRQDYTVSIRIGQAPWVTFEFGGPLLTSSSSKK